MNTHTIINYILTSDKKIDEHIINNARNNLQHVWSTEDDFKFFFDTLSKEIEIVSLDLNQNCVMIIYEDGDYTVRVYESNRIFNDIIVVMYKLFQLDYIKRI